MTSEQTTYLIVTTQGRASGIEGARGSAFGRHAAIEGARGSAFGRHAAIEGARGSAFGRRAAIGLEFVVETMRPLPIRAMAEASSCVLGVAIARGEATPVVDLGAVLSGAPSASPQRFVSVRAGERKVLLAVDRVIGVTSFDASAARALPPLLAGADEGSVAALGTRDDELLFVLRAGRLVDLAAKVVS